MDIKILLLGLLFITVNVYAGPVADAEEGFVKQDSSAENYQTELQENKIDIAKAYVKAQGIKVKALKSTANVYSQVTKDRKNYYHEYKKLAEVINEKAKKTEQKAIVETASLDAIENRRKEWEVRAREAETQGKDFQIQLQRKYSDERELSRKMEVCVIAAGVAEAEASGFENIANKERYWSSEIKSKAEELLNDAGRNHFTKAKEADQRATANKVKAQQLSEEAQKRFQAAKALEEQVLRVEVLSLNNLARFITMSIQAEENANKAKEDEMCAKMEEMISSELTKRAERVKAILKILKKENAFYESNAKKQEGEATMFSQSAHEVGSALVSHSASMLTLANAKEDSEIEHDEETFSGQQVKNMPFVAQKMID